MKQLTHNTKKSTHGMKKINGNIPATEVAMLLF